MSAGQGIGAIGGAVIGFFMGGPAGAAKGAYWGYMAGSIVDPPPGPHTEGPRLNDKIIQTSEEGAPLPIVFGSNRIAGNVIWSSGLEEIATTQEQGGGSGGGGATSTTYSYKTDAAISLCVGEIVGVRRIWADAKLIYDVGETVDVNTLLASNSTAAGIRIYTGSETQSADPLIQAIEGAANTPAFRGIAYVVFEDLQLADFGNRLPNFSFEVVQTGNVTQQYLIDSTTESNPFYSSAVQATMHHYDGDCIYFIKSVVDTRIFPGDTAGLLSKIQILPDSFGSVTPVSSIYSISWGSASGTSDSLVCGLNAFRPGTLNPYYIKSSGDHHLYYSISNGNYYGVHVTGGMLKCSIAPEMPLLFTYTPPFTLLTDTDSHSWGCGTSNDYVYFGVTKADGNACILKYLKSGAYVGEYTNNAMSSYAVISDEEIFIVIGSNLYVTADFGITLVLYAVITGYTSPGRGNYVWTLIKTQYNSVVICTGQNVTGAQIKFGMFSDRLQRITLGTQTLKDVAETLADQSGLAAAEYDMSALSADIVRGYVVSKPMTTRAALEPLQTAYHFDLSEVDGKIKAVKRGGSVVATIPADDLGAAESPNGMQLKLTRHNETELPSEIQISYSDIDNDHQAGTQYARSLTAQVTHIQQISLPLVMTSTEAARLAEVILNSARYTGRHTLEFSLGYAYSRLAPSDVVSVAGYGVQWSARIGQVDLGMPGLVQCVASPEIAALYASILAGSDPAGIGQTLGLSGVTTLNLLDCALLRDEDNSLGWYVALTGSVDTWPGGVVYKSNDGGATWTYAASATRTQGARLGSATAALPNADCRVWDKTNTINVRLQADAALYSITEANLIAGANSALLGAPGRWELIQFLNATLETDGTYTLRNLLRGRKGTEHAAGSHAVGDTFILLETASLQNLPATNAELNAARHFKALTMGQALEAVNQTTHTYAGERLRCLSPVELGGGRDASGNLTLNWKRRDRINAGWNDYADIPMSEASEAYEVEIYDSSYSTLKRTITGLSTPTASYTRAQQITDFGSSPSTVYARVYQLSATTGRGHYASTAVLITASASSTVLLHMDGSDGSAAITDATGNTTWTATGATISTSRSKYGGASANFNGSGYLTASSYAGFAFSESFTLDFWIWVDPGVTAWARVIENEVYNTTGGWHISFNGGDLAGSRRVGFQAGLNGGGGARLDSNAAIPTSQWVHIAVVRDSGVISMYINGIKQSATIVTSEPYTSEKLRIGANLGTPGNYFNGNVDEVRLVNGVAMFSGNFTPTGPYTE